MDTLTTAGVVFATTAGAALASLVLGQRLPGHHVDADSRDVVRLVAGLVAALAALVLGLLITSAKANYTERSDQLHRMAADIVALDRTLTRYGEDAQEARAVLRAVLADEVGRLSASDRLRGTVLEQPIQDARLLGFQDRLLALKPQTEDQRAARDQAVKLVEGVAETRVQMIQDPDGSIASPFLLVLELWLAVLFASFGLFVRPNATVVAALLAGAASVAGAVFLILELDRPLDGLIRLSTEPLRHAVEMMGH